jgi:hypothetical protein
VSDRHTSLGHHFDQVAIGKLIAQVPAHAQNDDLLFEVPALEQVALLGRLRMLGKARHASRAHVCTRASKSSGSMSGHLSNFRKPPAITVFKAQVLGYP